MEHGNGETEIQVKKPADALESGAFEEEAGEDEIRLLTSISTQFDLKPWADHEARFKSLEDEFFGHVTAKTEPD